MPRTKSSQSQHDAEVRRIADQLKEQGYVVTADVPGFPRPESVGGIRPDIVATKGKQREIVEVETPESVNSPRDRKQQRKFREAAYLSKNTNFQRRIAGK